MPHPVLLWSSFALFVLAMLWLDFHLFSGHAHKVRIKEALFWTALWIGLALLFNLGIFFFGTHEQAVNYLTGYLVEKSLGMDNLFVFLLIFNYFRVPNEERQGVLFWGIMLALVMRAIFIAAGVAIISAFAWTIYVLGAFLVFVGLKMMFAGERKIDLDHNRFLVFLRRHIPVTKGYEGGKFCVTVDGVCKATPLVIVFMMIAVMDLIFAVDSIPAILAITTDPFVVYTSNVFAIMGLRALYAVLAGLADMFRYLNFGLSLILVLIGLKMLAADVYHVPVIFTLGMVGAILISSVAASLIIPAKRKP